MKNYLFLFLAFLFSVGANAQNTYPVSGIYKQVSIEGNGCRITKTPESVYKLHAGQYALMFWVFPNNFSNEQMMSYRVEMAPNPEDPFCQKVKVMNQDSLVLTWYNNYRGFYDFPSNIWVDEVWAKVKNDANVKKLSDVLTNHSVNQKLRGAWKSVAIQVPGQSGDSLFITSPTTYKIYGESGCIMAAGSLFAVESSNSCTWRPVKWNSDNEFIEAGVKHVITSYSPTKMTVLYPNPNKVMVVETFIRVDVPEPLGTLFSNFK